MFPCQIQELCNKEIYGVSLVLHEGGSGSVFLIMEPDPGYKKYRIRPAGSGTQVRTNDFYMIGFEKVRIPIRRSYNGDLTGCQLIFQEFHFVHSFNFIHFSFQCTVYLVLQ